MDEPLNPFSEQKRAEPGSRQRHYVCNSHCKLRYSLISGPLTVIGFLIKGVLMGESLLDQPDFKPQIWCLDAFFVLVSSLYMSEKVGVGGCGGWLPNLITLHIIFSLSSSEYSSLPLSCLLHPPFFLSPLLSGFQPQGEILL